MSTKFDIYVFISKWVIRVKRNFDESDKKYCPTHIVHWKEDNIRQTVTRVNNRTTKDSNRSKYIYLSDMRLYIWSFVCCNEATYFFCLPKLNYQWVIMCPNLRHAFLFHIIYYFYSTENPQGGGVNITWRAHGVAG